MIQVSVVDNSSGQAGTGEIWTLCTFQYDRCTRTFPPIVNVWSKHNRILRLICLWVNYIDIVSLSELYSSFFHRDSNFITRARYNKWLHNAENFTWTHTSVGTSTEGNIYSMIENSIVHIFVSILILLYVCKFFWRSSHGFYHSGVPRWREDEKERSPLLGDMRYQHSCPLQISFAAFCSKGGHLIWDHASSVEEMYVESNRSLLGCLVRSKWFDHILEPRWCSGFEK